MFDGDVDFRTASGIVKGSVDGVADKPDDDATLALLEIKVRSSARLQNEEQGDDSVLSLCGALDSKWNQYSIPRLRAPWTHGLLVVLYQASCFKSFAGRDSMRVFTWRRGSPPVVRPAVQPPAAQPALPAPRDAGPMVASKSVALFKRLEEVGACTSDGWCKLSVFLEKLGLPKNQSKRYIQGKSAWVVGPGRGRKLKVKQDWDHKAGARGGVPPVHVTVAVLREVFAKYYGQKQLRL